MGKLTAKEVATRAKGKPGRYGDGQGLYFVVPKSGTPYWMLRYTSNAKRHEMTLSQYPSTSLADARTEASIKKKEHREGLDPLLSKRRKSQHSLQTVNDLFDDWIDDVSKRLTHPNIPARIYKKDIGPLIGTAKLDSVSAQDIRHIIKLIADSGRPTISNDALMYCKQLFNHGIKLDVVSGNPASAFSIRDAGGIEKSRDRYLSLKELQVFFTVCRENMSSFGRENFLACVLLVILGVRKSELTEAKWAEFSFEERVWRLPPERSKSGVGLNIPLVPSVLDILKDLKVIACESEYVFPSRRSSSRPCMGKDTLNRAIAKMFGRDPGKKSQPQNRMGDIEYFSVHDLRRTFRSLAAACGIHGHIAERCLNHKLKGVEAIYDRHDYFSERREAQQKVSNKILPLITGHII